MREQKKVFPIYTYGIRSPCLRESLVGMSNSAFVYVKRLRTRFSTGLSAMRVQRGANIVNELPPYFIYRSLSLVVREIVPDSQQREDSYPGAVKKP